MSPPEQRGFRLVVFASVAGFVLLSIYFAGFGPRVPVAGGLGWDGQHYGAMTHDFMAAASSGTVPTYRLARALPSFAVAMALAAFGIVKPDPPTIVLAFSIVNLLLFVGAALLWRRIAAVAAFSAPGAWLGFLLLFLNYASIREPYFAPVTTDHFALFLGLLSLLLYLQGRTVALFFATLAAMFTWPVAFLLNAAMLAFPHRPGALEARAPGQWLAPVDKALRIAAVALFAALTAYFLYLRPAPMPHGAAQVDYSWAALSIAISLAYGAWLARSAPLRPLFAHGRFSVRGILVFLAALSVFLCVRHALSTQSSGLMETETSPLLLRLLVVEPAVRPAQFLVAHAVWWGPAILLFIAWLPRAFDFSAPYPALYIGTALFAVFLWYSESRSATYFLPVAAFALAGAVSRRSWRPSVAIAAAIFIATLALSRFWLPMAATPFGDALEFPAQWFFMQFGPWMGNTGYLLALAQTVASCAVLWLVRKNEDRPAAAA